MKARPAEVVYAERGTVVEELPPALWGSKYIFDEQGEPEFGQMRRDGTRYFGTTQFRSHFSREAGIDLTGFDLCPAVDFWVFLAARSKDERGDYELLFAMNTARQMHEVAAYYGLPAPADDAVLASIEACPAAYCFRNAGGRPLVLAGVMFIGGQPQAFRLYTYPKALGTWDVWMYGMAWHNGGQCWEAGAVYTKETGGEALPGTQMRWGDMEVKATVIHSERADGVSTQYEFLPCSDPVLFWQGRERDAQGRERIKRYQSSAFVRRMVGGKQGGPLFATSDLCPAVRFWLGRAWYADADEQELLFAVTGGSAQLDQVAVYYGLPAPYGAQQKAWLDEAPEKIRARHYDLYGLGEGRYAPVVVGSVMFVDKRPVRLLLYTFLRQWEFDEQIELPPLNC